MHYEIKTIVEDFYLFLKNPQEIFTESLSAKQKWKVLSSILLLDFTLVIIVSGILSFIDSFLFKLESNEDILSNNGVFSILIIAAIFVPLIEELIFRFALKYDRNLLFQFIVVR
ncbi:MAG: hypothetical protein PHC38_07820 [Weeksellaceae bacterium]|nr:hypothetical protein [Weeksellaceae bacterium]